MVDKSWRAKTARDSYGSLFYLTIVFIWGEQSLCFQDPINLSSFGSRLPCVQSFSLHAVPLSSCFSIALFGCFMRIVNMKTTEKYLEWPMDHIISGFPGGSSSPAVNVSAGLGLCSRAWVGRIWSVLRTVCKTTTRIRDAAGYALNVFFRCMYLQIF